MIPGDALQHLQEARDSFFGWLEASTWCVVVGIVMEGPEVFHDFADVVKGTSKSANPWVKLVACVGWLLIVLGVVGEGYYEAKVSRADGGIQAYEHSRVGDIGNEADAVSGKLQNAVNQASTALSKSGIAETIAEGATTKAELASRRSALADRQH